MTKHRLRGYDAVQLATALKVNDIVVAAGLDAIVFVTADRDLIDAAGREALVFENPLNYP